MATYDNTNLGAEADQIISGTTGADVVTDAVRSDTLISDDVLVGGSSDGVITDFDVSNSDAIDEADTTNNDFIDLSAYYGHISELRTDMDGDGILNQSTGNLSDRASLGGGAQTVNDTSSSVLAADNINVACFAKGVLIETEDGQVPVEQLKRGMRLRTADGGLRPLRALLRSKVDGTGELAPVRISAGTLGNDRELLVSPAHRMLISGWRAEMLYGCDEVLVSAAHLVRGDMITRVPMERVTYFHVLLDRHEIIFAEGAATESYHLTREAVDAAEYGDFEEGAAAMEIERTFPELLLCVSRCARPVIQGYEARALSGML